MLKTAVVGCGTMGRNHLRVLSDVPDVDLVAAADDDPRRLADLPKKYGVQTFTSHLTLLEEARPDCIVVAVPTLAHYSVALDAMSRGVDTLVEKPIASTVAEGEAMAKRGQEAGVVLAVGHVEHFNPAITELKRRLDAGELGRVFQASVRRLGPFPERVRDVGVVLDLAPHDIDVLRYLLGSPVDRVFMETEQKINTEHEDMVSGTMRFRNGVVASIDINWLTPTKVRILTLTGERGMFVVDYLTQDLVFFANDYAKMPWEALRVLTGVSEGSMIKYLIKKREPLRVELESFAKAVIARRAGMPAPTNGALAPVSASEGLEALRLATLMVASGRTGSVVDA